MRHRSQFFTSVNNATANLVDNCLSSHASKHFNSLKVLYTNADGFTISKQTELKCYIQEFEPDIIAITEILPKHTVFYLDASHYIIDGYNMFYSDLTQGRGCVCYSNSSIPASRRYGRKFPRIGMV